jgi:hypothetical protein
MSRTTCQLAQKVNIEICIKANNSKKKAKTELLPKDFVPELNTENLGNSTSFLTITHMTLSAKCFISYGILTIDIAAEFFSWTDQWPKRIFNFRSWIGRNSGSLEYHFGR